MEKDKGYEFLFGDNKKSGAFQCEDGSEGYIYSDGSGYYRGADGSDGYIYSDGSGYFHGADGSDGYKYSDGSGYFRGGANDVDAFQYSDGSGYYGDAKHERAHYWPIEKDDNSIPEDLSSYSSDDSVSSWAELGGVLLGIGLLSLIGRKNKHKEPDIDTSMYREAQEQKVKIEREQQEERKRKRKAFCQKHWRGILFTILCIILSAVISIAILQYRKMIPMSHDSENLLGMDYEQTIMLLHEAGFTNVQGECTRDLNYENIEKENQVYQIYIFDKNSFVATDKYPYDTEITVMYHGVKFIPVPISSKSAKGENYEDIATAFEDAGFGNIVFVVKYDIITGWITDDGEIESITINGEKKFDDDAYYRPDAEVIITYHTLRKNQDTE